MAGDQDRQILHEMELRLAAEDPTLVSRFAALEPVRRVLPGLLQITGSLVLATLMLLAGATAGAIAFAGAAVLIGLARRYAADPRPRTGVD